MNKKRKTKVVIACAMGSLVLCGIVIFGILYLNGKFYNSETKKINLGNEKIETLYGVTGTKLNVESITNNLSSNEDKKLEIIYNLEIDKSSMILEKYHDYLYNNNYDTIGLGFGSDTYQEYAKESSKSGWYVNVEIRSTRVDRQTEQLRVTYRMVNGTIPKFKSED